MLTETYIEELLADERAADHVWALWNAGFIPKETALIAWLIVGKDN